MLVEISNPNQVSNPNAQLIESYKCSGRKLQLDEVAAVICLVSIVHLSQEGLSQLP